MTDAAENVNDDYLEDGAELPDEQEVEDQQEAEVEPEKSAPRGYMSKEAWISSGKDPEKWVSPELFEERGERIKMKAHYDSLLKNQSLLHQIQLKNQREELLAKRDDAIDIADKDAVKRYDKQIKELDALDELAKEPQPAAASGKAPEIAEWEAENPWCYNQEDPKTKLANRVFNEATAQGKTTATALRMVDRELAAKFSSKSNTPRQLAEGARGNGGAKESTALTLESLTKDERLAWDEGFFTDKKVFLELVAIERKNAKK